MRMLAPRLLAIPALLVTLAAAEAAELGPYATFRDWIVGCDNLRSCTALGLPAGEDTVGGYVRISRGGASEDAPEVTFNVFADSAPPGSVMRLSVEGATAGKVPVEPLPATATGGAYVTARLTGEAALSFISALPNGKGLHVALEANGKRIGEANLSLAGSAAALLFLDDKQKRVGTVTALFKKGSVAASAIPPVPPAPVIRAMKIEALDPAPKPPADLPPPAEDDCNPETGTPVAFGLPQGLTLWGTCSSTGAYNFAYRFYLVGRGKPEPLSFDIAGEKPDPDMAGILVNPVVVEGGKTLDATNLGRGLGDCGDSQDWTWDGTSFVLVSYAKMDDCRGVVVDDWPVLYSARVE